MVEKPISGDEEQRRAQTRAAREQSGLPPEETAEDEVTREPAREPAHDPHDRSAGNGRNRDSV